MVVYSPIKCTLRAQQLYSSPAASVSFPDSHTFPVQVSRASQLPMPSILPFLGLPTGSVRTEAGESGR